MNREEFKIYTEDTITDLSHRIDELRQRAVNINDDKKFDFDNELEILTDMRDNLKIYVDDYNSYQENDLTTFKKNFNEKLGLLKSEFDKLFNILSS